MSEETERLHSAAGRRPVERAQRGERNLRLGKGQLRRLKLETAVPAQGSAFEARRVFPSDQDREFEGIVEVQLAEFTRGEFSVEEAPRADGL